MKAYHAELRVDHGDRFTIYRGESLNDARIAMELDFGHLTFSERHDLKKKNAYYDFSCYEANADSCHDVLEIVFSDLIPDKFLFLRETYIVGINTLVKE